MGIPGDCAAARCAVSIVVNLHSFPQISRRRGSRLHSRNCYRRWRRRDLAAEFLPAIVARATVLASARCMSSAGRFGIGFLMFPRLLEGTYSTENLAKPQL